MDTQRVEALERRMKRIEERMRGVIAGWILSVTGLLLVGVMVQPAFSVPSGTVLPVLRADVLVIGLLHDQHRRN